MIRLLPLDAVRPSAYNPRESDPERLDLVELSLRKLGWLLPIYADKSGEILSGHQRHLVAERMGCKRVPVAATKAMDLVERKAVNIVFNRGTNDLRTYDTPKNLTTALQHSEVEDFAAALPDKDVDGEGFYPCMATRRVPLKPLLEVNAGRWIDYATSIARSLYHKGIVMPLVVDPDMRVVNGLGRLKMLAEKGHSDADVVAVSHQEAPLAESLLNLLSMDFDIHRRYADLLRHNSFRRAHQMRPHLGRGFVFTIVKNGAANKFDINHPAHLARWKTTYGTCVLDFGAGHLTETEMLRAQGIDVTPFEPYRLGKGNEIDKAASVALAREFLSAVGSGKRWDSIFLSSVLNSVPFVEDRQHIVALCAALCTARTRLYAAAMSEEAPDLRSASGEDFLKNSRQISFLLPYEPNIKLGNFSGKPKVQKYHTPKEFYELFRARFSVVQVTRGADNVEAVSTSPLPLDVDALRAAVEFEFNLPYPDGSRMGLVALAKAAFSKRLGVQL